MALWGRLGKMTVMLSLAAYACGGKTNMADTTCEPGATVDCSTSCPGQSVCLADGSGWSECSCGSGGSGYGGSGYGGSGYGGGGYTGGYGGAGYGGGGYGGSSYGGSSYGGAGGSVPCSDECPSYLLGGIITMSGCCAADGSCGGYVDPSVGSIISLNEGCYPTNQPSVPDPNCPPYSFINPIDGSTATYAGCCTTNGTCGVDVDLTPAQGPYLGCTQSAGEPGKPCGGTQVTCSTCVQNECSNDIADCLSDNACTSILLCTQNCNDSACLQDCVSQYPSGASHFTYGVLVCTKQNCALECKSLLGG